MSTLDSSFVFVDGSPGTAGAPLTTAKRESKDAERGGSASPYAHDWHPHTTGGLRISGRHIVDKHGRVCQLRGVNISGACKTPSNDDHAIFPHKHEDATFVGRPFSLEEAPEHFARLRRWGLTFIRFVVTWEAIEHAGPGRYDTEYLDYIRSLLSLLPEYGLVAFVEMHQDVWSRYTGGSGAPAWTVSAVGFDIHNLEDAGAAWLRGVRGGGHTEGERGVWPCGYQKLAAATLATCFWAGEMFAPRLRIEGMSAQQYLQERYLKAWEVLVRAVGDLEGVIGFEMMNEPHRGYIEAPSMHSFDYNTDLHLSYVPSALQSFALGAGHAVRVPFYTRSFPMPTKLTSHELLNIEEINVWREDGPTVGKCLWEMHDVWGWDKMKKEAITLREHYFTKHPLTDKKVDWYTDCYYPLLLKWAEMVRAASSPDKLVFAEPIPNELCPTSWSSEHCPPNFVFAPHWYDLNGLFNKAFGNFSVNVQGLSRGMFPLNAFYWGQEGARKNFSLQIRNIVESAYRSLGEVPLIFGECGVPMDLNGREAFKSGDFKWQNRFMDAMITGLEGSLVGFTLWNYNPDNDDDKGDYWNGENFSWFSRHRARAGLQEKEKSSRFSSSSPSPPALTKAELDQSSSALDEGGRILRAVVRPYPAKTAGIPLRFEYEMNTGSFVFGWAEPESNDAAPSALQTPSTFSPASPPASGPPAPNNPPLHIAHTLTTNETEIFIPAMLLAHSNREVVVEGLRSGENATYDKARQTLVLRTRSHGPPKSPTDERRTDDDAAAAATGSSPSRRPRLTHRIQVSLKPPLEPVFVVNSFWGDFGMWIVAVLVALFAVVSFR